MDSPQPFKDKIFIYLPCSLCFLVQKCSEPWSVVFHLLTTFFWSVEDSLRTKHIHSMILLPTDDFSLYYGSSSPIQTKWCCSIPSCNVGGFKTSIQVNTIMPHLWKLKHHLNRKWRKKRLKAITEIDDLSLDDKERFSQLKTTGKDVLHS